MNNLSSPYQRVYVGPCPECNSPVYYDEDGERYIRKCPVELGCRKLPEGVEDGNNLKKGGI